MTDLRIKRDFKIIDKIKNDFNIILENIPDNVLKKIELDSIYWYQSLMSEEKCDNGTIEVKDNETSLNLSNDNILTPDVICLPTALSEESVDVVVDSENKLEEILSKCHHDDLKNDWNSEIKRYQLEIKELSEKNRILENKFSILKNERDTIQNELLQCTQDLEEKENAIKVQKRQLKDITKMYIKKEEFERCEKSIEELEETNKKMKSENKLITKELSSLKEDLSDYEKKVASKDNIIKTLRQELRGNVKEEEIEKYLKEIEDLKKKSLENINEKDKFSEEYEKLKKVVADKEKNEKEYNTEMSIKNSKISSLESKLDSTEKILKEKENIIQKKDQAMDCMKSKIRTTQNVNSNESVALKEMDRKLYSLTLELEQMENKIENYKDTLEQKFKECELQKQEIVKYKAELNDFKRRDCEENNSHQLHSESHTIECEEVILPQPSESPKRNTPQYPEWWKLHMKNYQ